MLIILNNVKLIKHALKSYCKVKHYSGLSAWNEELTPSLKHRIEKYWRSKLKFEPYDETNNKKEKYYVLSMFPYPSGYLHMGHVRVYTISDAIARYQRLNGKNVIHPIGWDAFGLPAENAAIERRIPPDEWTQNNIEHMKKQLVQLGCSFEWHREIATCDPSYYRWTQDLFLKLFDAGLIYQKDSVVKWDPVDRTVLAEEQVDENGCSWRSGAKVENKVLRQWFIRTTRFAKDLYEGLDDSVLQDWKDIIKIQRNWIGQCDGVTFDFKLKDYKYDNGFITVWTNKPENVEDIKFIAVTNNHILAEGSSTSINTAKLPFVALNPFTNQEIPVFVTSEIDFLENTDSHVGIPGISEADAEFALKHGINYTIPSKPLSSDDLNAKRNDVCIKSMQLNIGGYWTSAKLRDWLISRQRYWGTPIPIIHCDNCGVQPVPRKDLPIALPKLSKLSEKGMSVLAECTEWVNTTCPKCGNRAKRETDTMDTFVDSTWYYLRYLDPNYTEDMFNIQKAMKMTPVDLYIGGKEHATLHLYYARFISHFLHSLDLVPEREPFKRLLVQGLIKGRSYRLKGTGKYLKEDEIEIIDLKRNAAVCKATGEPVVICWEKMSKSKHNGVDPNDMFNEYGVDTTRLLVLADVSPTSHRNWNTNTFPGIINWQKRLWLTLQEFLQYRKDNVSTEIQEDEFRKHDDYMFDSRNYYVKGASFNYCTSQQISVAISKMQGLTNSLRRVPPVVFAKSPQFERALACQIIMLAPIAPHFASELWSGFVSAPNRLSTTEEIDWDKDVLEQKWPKIDSNYNMDIVCLINGEEICVVKVPKNVLNKLSKEEAIELALKQKDLQNVLGTLTIRDIDYKAYSDYDSDLNIRVANYSKKKKKSKSTLVA